MSLKKSVIGFGLSVLAQCLCTHAFAFDPDIEYGGFASVDLARAELTFIPADGTSRYVGDILISAGLDLRIGSYFDVEGGVAVSPQFIRNAHGHQFGGTIFGGFTVPRRSSIGLYFGLGMSGNSFRNGCEPVYGDYTGYPQCREVGRGYLSGGYRVGLKFRERDGKRIRVMFSHTFGKDGFQLMTLGIGGESK